MGCCLIFSCCSFCQPQDRLAAFNQYFDRTCNDGAYEIVHNMSALAECVSAKWNQDYTDNHAASPLRPNDMRKLLSSKQFSRSDVPIEVLQADVCDGIDTSLYRKLLLSAVPPMMVRQRSTRGDGLSPGMANSPNVKSALVDGSLFPDVPQCDESGVSTPAYDPGDTDREINFDLDLEAICDDHSSELVRSYYATLHRTAKEEIKRSFECKFEE